MAVEDYPRFQRLWHVAANEQILCWLSVPLLGMTNLPNLLHSQYCWYLQAFECFWELMEEVRIMHPSFRLSGGGSRGQPARQGPPGFFHPSNTLAPPGKS